jgi:uncharacterized membrane protein YeaQ/YmgE (transglycosylase-associated protein family)
MSVHTVLTVLSWVALGLVAGYIGSKIVNRTGEGLVGDVLLGIVGSVVGSFMFQKFGWYGVTGFNAHSIVVAVAGAIVVLLLWHMFFRSRPA